MNPPRLFALALALGLFSIVGASSALAQEKGEFASIYGASLSEDAEAAKADYNKNVRNVGYGLKAIGMGLAVVGAGLGIGLAAKGAVESYARQPEMQPQTFIAFMIAAALIEGLAFAALIFTLFIL